MDLKLNSDLPPSDRLLVFQFKVSSVGGQVLNQLAQLLGAGGAVVGGHRRISPPGRVFHLSVRSRN
jgi:hypothetical protein